MTIDSNLKQRLTEAEAGLAQILHSLTFADLGLLALNERKLLDLVGIFCYVERSVRMEPAVPIRGSLLGISAVLKQCRQLSSLALAAIERQMEIRHLTTPGPRAALCVEG